METLQWTPAIIHLLEEGAKAGGEWVFATTYVLHVGIHTGPLYVFWPQSSIGVSNLLFASHGANMFLQ